MSPPGEIEQPPPERLRRDDSLTDTPSEVGPVDLVLFCVKSHDTEEAASRLGPLLQPETAVLSLKNVIDNEDRIEAVIGPGHVMGGMAFVFVALAAPGVIEHTGTTSRIVFGELDGRPSDRAERIIEALVAGGVNAETTRTSVPSSGRSSRSSARLPG